MDRALHWAFAIGLLASVPSISASDVSPPPSTNILYGPITSDRTLTAASPGPIYDVIGDLTVNPGVTLTIEPGVTLRMTANSDFLASGNCIDKVEIEVQGQLRAEG